MVRFGSPARLFVLFAALAVALAVPARSFAQAPTFNAFISTPKGGEPWFQPGSAAVGDFNGDGKLDAIVTDGSYHAVVRLLLGNGNGTFAQSNVPVPPSLPITTNPTPGMIRAADLNGDGRLDAVFVSPQGNLAPAVLLNTGNVIGVPQFTSTTYTPAYSGLRSVTIGDLNGDGRPDFIVGNAYGSLWVYLNDGNGAFAVSQVTNLMPNVGGSTGQGVIIDLNGDAKADYVVSSNQTPAIDVFLGNGDGTLQTAVPIPSFGQGLAVADVNDDGQPDLISVNGVSLMVYLNGGGGTFGSAVLYPIAGASNPTSVTVADLNGDGELDAVTGNFGSNNVAVLLGNGTGSFGAATVYAANLGPLDVSVADFNNDGKLDIATVGWADRSYGVLTNTTVLPVTCTAGSYLASPGDTACTLAPAGSFVAGHGATAATQCPVGTYSSVAGATSCTLAAAGSFVAAAGSVAATACPVGTYSTSAGSASCALAPTGYFVAAAGSVAPTACAPGSYSDTVGAAACTPAPAGSFVGNAGASSATACQAGYGSAAGATSCYALDTDGDGVNNDVDAYPNSNRSAFVSVAACATGVTNRVTANGATFNDLIAAALGGGNHGANVSAVSKLSNGWKSAGLISGRDHGAIVSCTAKSK